VAYCGTLFFLYAMGINFDLLSIIGLILVVGVLVDDAIIISERHVENLENGMSPRESALEAVRDLIVPVTGTILTTAVAFSPILLIKSEMSTLLYAVPIVIIVSLALSWWECFFVLPNHLAHFVKKAPKDKSQRLFAKMKSTYTYLLHHALKWRYVLVLGVTLILGLSAYIAVKKVRHNFELRIQSERLSVYAILKKSPSLDYTEKKIKPLEDYLIHYPTDKIENVFTSIGDVWRNGQRSEGYRYAKINVYLDRNYPYPTKMKEKLQKALTEKLKKFKSKDFEKLYVEAEKEDNNESKQNLVKVHVSGGDEVDFADIEKAVIARVKGVKGVVEHVAQSDRYQTTWEFAPNRNELVRYGLGVGDLTEQVRSAFVPHELAELRFSGKSLFVYTELKRSENLQFADLNHFDVVGNNGVAIPIGLLGKWEQKKSLANIGHYNGERSLDIEFKYNNKLANIISVKANIKKILKPIQKEFPSYLVEVQDADKQQAKSFAWAIRVALLCIVAVMLVIALILGSLTQPILVGMPIPCGLIGIIWALYLHDMPLGVMALIGLLGTVGVSVNASLIMVDQINKRVKENGKWSRETIIEGAASRLRAIFLTTVTTLGGVIPMAYSIGGESGFTQPLAFSMGWGLTFATLLTLFVLPALLEIRLDLLSLLTKTMGLIFKKPVAELAIAGSAIDSGEFEKVLESFRHKKSSDLVGNENQVEKAHPQEGPPLH